jgi:hypothetical protein
MLAMTNGAYPPAALLIFPSHTRALRKEVFESLSTQLL